MLPFDVQLTVDVSDHLNNLKPDTDSGFWVMGGAMLDEPIKEGSGPKINGSIMMAVADSKEEVLEKLKKDVYWTGGVWDTSNVSASNGIAGDWPSGPGQVLTRV